MAIKTEFYRTREDGVNLYRTYSDEGFYIVQNETGVEYEEAIDVENAPYTYSETDKPIDPTLPDDEFIAEYERILTEPTEEASEDLTEGGLTT